MDRVLRALGIGRREARFVAIGSLGSLLLLAWLAWSFQHSPAGLTPLDVAVLIGMGLIGAVVTIVSGWLGFTHAGLRYSEKLLTHQLKELAIVRIIKVAFATGAMAFAASEVLFFALLFIGGSDSVMIFFKGNAGDIMYGAFFLLFLPIAMKYLR